MLSIFYQRFDMTLRTDETDSAATRVIHFQNRLSANDTKQSLVQLYRH